MNLVNGATPVLDAVAKFPDRPALIFPRQEVLSFGQLESEAKKFQRALKNLGIRKGETILLGEAPSPALYAFVLAALAQGTAVAVIEPWMPLEKIESVVRGLKPRLFLTGLLGRLWGARSPSIRAIPDWKSLAGLKSYSSNSAIDAGGSLEVTNLRPDELGLVAFTSGTTGLPKGVPRRHQYLLDQHRVLKEALHHDQHDNPELTIFTNFVFANLASARGSVVIPTGWKTQDLRWASELQGVLAPETGTMGPAFLRRLVLESGYKSLRSIHVGGALTDTAILESAFGRFRDAQFLHVYGSSEAEPVATIDAKEAVQLSHESERFQTLALGRPIPQIEIRTEISTTWVKGPHVCPMYIGEEENVREENRLNKRMDESGAVWHAMGDRVQLKNGVLWYGGRSSQSLTDFEREQQLYSVLDTSKLFLHREKDGTLQVYFEEGKGRLEKIKDAVKLWNEEVSIFRSNIVRDRRHRARIDRSSTRLKSKKVATIHRMERP